MRGEKKTPKAPGFMRVVVAANVGRLLDHHYRHLPTITQRQRALAKDCGVGFGTVQRIMKHEVGASLDNIESICDALQVQVYQLLLPSLDARNPQVVQGATEAEQRMYRIWKRTGRAGEEMFSTRESRPHSEHSSMRNEAQRDKGQARK